MIVCEGMRVSVLPVVTGAVVWFSCGTRVLCLVGAGGGGAGVVSDWFGTGDDGFIFFFCGWFPDDVSSSVGILFSRRYWRMWGICFRTL